jgi:hypothetical protein
MIDKFSRISLILIKRELCILSFSEKLLYEMLDRMYLHLFMA